MNKYKHLKQKINNYFNCNSKNNKIERDKLSIIHVILTNQASYIIFNTQTIQNYDCVNIVIERNGQTILEDIILEESLGTMCGDSFNSVCVSSINKLREWVKSQNENIIQDTIIIK